MSPPHPPTPDTSLRGKRALVTGATAGIGRAVALAYAEAGADLVLSGRDEDRLAAVAARCEALGSSVRTRRADLATEAGVAELVATTSEAEDPRLDVLVHCAGAFHGRTRLVDTSAEAWHHTLAVHLSAAQGLIRGLFHALERSPAGSIVLVSSGLGVRARPELGAYVAAKFGLEGFHQALAQELEGGSVRVNLVLPGRVDTDMHRRAFPEASRAELASPGEVTRLFVHLASDASRGTHGARLDAREWTA